LYRRPNLTEWIKEIDSILEAIGQCCIGNDKVERIYIDCEELHIETSYSIRGCSMTNDMVIPISVIVSTKSIYAAKVHRIRERITTAERRVNEYRTSLDISAKELAQAIVEYENLSYE
jgi:hypothetical protein